MTVAERATVSLNGAWYETLSSVSHNAHVISLDELTT